MKNARGAEYVHALCELPDSRTRTDALVQQLALIQLDVADAVEGGRVADLG